MIKKFVFAVMLLISGLSVAQEGGTASPYSFYGLGTVQFKGTGENQAMGGLSTYSDSLHLNLRNPASLGRLKYVTFAVGGTHSEIKVKDASREDNTTSTTFNYLAFGFPIIKDKMGISFGIIPYTSVGYNLDGSSENVVNRFEGRGGLNRVFLSTGYEIAKGLTLGVTANYNFGNIQTESLRTQDNVELGTKERNRSDLRGATFNFGAQYEQMVSEQLEVRASASYVTSNSIESENMRQVSSVLFNNLGLTQDLDLREIDLPDSQFAFPSALTVGLGIGQPNKWFVGAEYSQEETSNLSVREFTPGNSIFVDASSYRIGGFYSPKYNSVSSYWQRVTYRAGFRYEETGILLNGESIDEFGITFGIGLPVGRLLSNANLNFEYGQRGTTDANLVQENIFKIGISFSFNDVWFQELKFN